MGRSRPKAFGKTLPDYLAPGLNIVFVGLNPGRYSVEAGHYFARPQNRFWSALSASGLVTHSVSPEDDASLLKQGIGFTDLVKRPTRGIHELSRDEYKAGVETLRRKLMRSSRRSPVSLGSPAIRFALTLTQPSAYKQNNWDEPIFSLFHPRARATPDTP